MGKVKTQDGCNKQGCRDGATPAKSLENSLNFQQLDLERQRGVGRNRWRPPLGAVSKAGRDDDAAFAAHFHRLKRFVPSGDQAGAELKLGGRAAFVGVIKLFPILEPADVMTLHCLAQFRSGAVADLQIGVLESGRGGDFVPGLAPAICHYIRHGRCRHGKDQNDRHDFDVEAFPTTRRVARVRG